jgi:hypothetical protein
MISHIALLAQDRTYAWRGQNDASWDFSASLFREIRDEGREVTEERLRKRELEILDEARRWGLGRDLVRPPRTCTSWRCCSITGCRRD